MKKGRTASLSDRRRYPQISIKGPVTLFVIVLVLMVTLTVLWHVALVKDYQMLKRLTAEAPFHWTFIALGSILFLTIIVLASILSAQLIAQIRWRQRQSNFISSVSHELNSPLSSIKLFAQTLRKPDLGLDDRLDFVGKIVSDVDRLHRLIANILRAAEMDYHGDELQVVTQRVELNEYLRRFVTDASAVASGRGLRLRLRLEAKGEQWVKLDRQMFRQVLDNLVDNAVHYRGDDPPRVDILVRRLGGDVEVRLSDRGIGIPEEELTKLFDRFYRIEETDRRRKRKGTGIGLYVVRSIVQAHGGRVYALSDGPGNGSTMVIRLPSPPELQYSAAREDSQTSVLEPATDPSGL
ncbi:MAG: HAMP domain-containing sensor histidine kinase [Acidobacteriota bacterium]